MFTFFIVFLLKQNTLKANFKNLPFCLANRQMKISVQAQIFTWLIVDNKKLKHIVLELRGDNQIRTGDDGVADRSLTTWLCSQTSIVYQYFA